MAGPTPDGLQFRTNGNVTRMVIDSTGKVGISATNPKGKLDIRAGSNDTDTLLAFTESNTPTFYFQSGYAGGGESGNYLKLQSTWGNFPMTWRGNGDIGLGTTNPLGKLSLTNNNVSTVDLLFRTDDGILGNTNWSTARIQAGWETGEDDWSDAFLKFENPTASNTYSTTMTLKGGKVGIGTTAPDSPLHVFKGSAGNATGHPNAMATFENSTNGFLNILTPDNVQSGILFGDPEEEADGGIIYNHSVGTP